jgi:large subunit ribosomal protein L23
MNKLIKKPLISEKSFGKVASGKYTFVVDRNADKEDIAKACTDLFGVTVVSVNTANYQGKVKRTKKGEGSRSDYKKAIITVKAGQKIDLFEIEGEEEKNKKKKERKEEKGNKQEKITKRT